MSALEQKNPTRRTLFVGFVILAAVGAALVVFLLKKPLPPGEDEFTRVMNVGKNYLDKGEADKALAAFNQAVALNPTHPDAQLNLANACLLAGQSENAIQHAQEVLNLDHNSAAAHYVAGCANLRLARFEPAVQALQQSKDLDPNVAAVTFQLGLAHLQLKHWDDAIAEFQAAIALEAEHPAAHYNLSQALIRAGRQDEANQELETHRQLAAKSKTSLATAATYERCKHTQARTPFQLEQPLKDGVKVVFVDQTQAAFGNTAQNYQGPIGVIDINHRGQNDLFVLERGQGFRLLLNTNGTFQPQGEPLPALEGAQYSRCLVGDLQHDRYEDVIVLGDKGTHVFKFVTNGAVSDISAFTRLASLAAVDGALVDLDFTGNVDLLAVTAGTNSVRLFRNLGNMLFRENTATSGVPASLTTARQLAVDDWNNDDLMDVFVAREGAPPLLLAKQRGGPLAPTNPPVSWPSGTALAVGDLNNDLRPDLVVATTRRYECIFGGLNETKNVPVNGGPVKSLTLVDYDNDGWLDVCATGDRLRIWRNLGRAGFQEQTQKLGLDRAAQGPVEFLAAADFDLDGDTDLLLGLPGKGLQLLRNDGGNANYQLKLRLMGNRSNASGLGVRIELTAAGWRTIRTVTALPIEVGVGRHAQLDSVTLRWFDLADNSVDVKVDAKMTLTMAELILPTGSCPYLYAWDGRRFRFVTDILGASPMGLPASETHYIDADTDEFVWVGDEQLFQPKGEEYVMQITSELREVLYLDEATLFVADHPAGTEVHSTDKLVPGRPFPRSELITLHRRQPLRQATRLDGTEVAELLAENDGKVVSPGKLRVPQLRGLAEPHGVVLDFGPLETERPLVVALTGWLRFGGGMANVAASLNPDLPFPFPILEAEAADGLWKPVDVVVGAPIGKTKTIVVDLAGKLSSGSRRLRLTTAYEIHWDRIALFERRDPSDTKVTALKPSRTDLHWHGFGEFEDRPWFEPLTPRHDKVSQSPKWRINPTGWCTRYGPVDELVMEKDDALALVNAGDELTLSFAARQLPEKPAGVLRDFFLYTVGWEKDSDFHVAQGWKVDPLPFHGMDDQRYGQQARPVNDGDGWMQKYNTRWVGPLTLNRAEP